jgi:glycosyltransferase involved in cell wall biosynthesis
VAIIGDGPERERLDAYVEQSGLRDVIRFFGARDDVADLLPDFDVFVLPSLAEGISNTILEAMACGLPVIATRVGGNPELVEHGRTGMLVGTDDPEALAGAILHYFNNSDDTQRHAGAARKAAVDRFSIDRMVREYTSLYDELLSPRGASPARARERAG